MKRFLLSSIVLLLLSTMAVGFANSNVIEKASYCVDADQVQQEIQSEEINSVVFAFSDVEPIGGFVMIHPDLGYALTDYPLLAEQASDVILPVNKAPPNRSQKFSFNNKEKLTPIANNSIDESKAGYRVL